MFGLLRNHLLWLLIRICLCADPPTPNNKIRALREYAARICVPAAHCRDDDYALAHLLFFEMEAIITAGILVRWVLS